MAAELSPRSDSYYRSAVSTSERRVLVAYASRMGSTAEIAEAIADQLRTHGLDVVTAACSAAPDPDGFDAVLVGSAVYATRRGRSARASERRSDHRAAPVHTR